MNINEKTMIFEDLSNEEADAMLVVLENIVLRGEVPSPFPPWLKEWMETFGYNGSQGLLLVSTAFPQRALLSLVYHYMLKH